MTTFEKLLEEKESQGLEKGLQEGLDKGRQKGLLETARNLQKEGSTEELIMKVTGLTHAQLVEADIIIHG